MAVTYKPNYDKILEALVWIANQRPEGLDFFHVGKVLYYADKIHLNKYARPVLGDVYVSMKEGPVPSKAYDMLKRSHPYLDGEMLENISAALKIDNTGRYPKMKPRRRSKSDVFSQTDIAALTESVERYADMPFDDLWNLVHNDPGYLKTLKNEGLNRSINFEDLIDPDAEDRDQLIREIRETAAHLVM